MDEDGFLFLDHAADDVVSRCQALLYFLAPVGTVQFLLVHRALQVSPLLVELVAISDHRVSFEIVAHRVDILDIAELQRRVLVVAGIFVATALEFVPVRGNATPRVENGDSVRL
jgi:hypothetical protein